MKEQGFESFDFIRKGFSAHPKIDPNNGDIFNIGFNVQTFDVYKMTKDFKLLAKNTINIRVPQSIHDCCLAGDYLVVFECPVKLDTWKLLKGYFPPKCYSADYDYKKTVAWIFKK
jgi:carotenoid cleavage dioxygenase-like enzyme